jgi:hypothetical protein
MNPDAMKNLFSQLKPDSLKPDSPSGKKSRRPVPDPTVKEPTDEL